MTSRVNKGGRGRVTKPQGTPGVSIDREAGQIVCTFEDTMSAFTVTWSISNASMVRDMLTEAIEKGAEAKQDVTLASGLVIPAPGPHIISGSER